ncbi:MAG: hypothetical protein R3D32_14755 [Nitratireductor sp.]
MSAVLALFGLAARHGRGMLVAGLIAGMVLPDLALAMRPWLQELVAALLFVTALRIGPKQALGAVRDLPAITLVALIYQLALPLALALVLLATGLSDYRLATALVLMLSASSISGAPSLAILTGHDPAPALRILVIGTALLPLTVLPVFAVLPAFAGADQILGSAGRLFAVIALASATAFAIRGFVLKNPERETIAALDGLSAIAMAIVVVGLMSSVGPALLNEPVELLPWLAAAFIANFGMQILAALTLRLTPLHDQHVPLAIVAGNRNIALFLVALPASLTDPLLLFIGCYQIPMYLTPILLRRFYAGKQ